MVKVPQLDVSVSKYRLRQRDLLPSIEQKNHLVYFCDFNDLMKRLNLEHDTTEWMLFIDSCLLILKAVLLHIGNRLDPAVPM